MGRAGGTNQGALSALLGNRAGYIMSAFFVCICSSHRSGGSFFGIRSRGAETLGAERIQQGSTRTLLSATHRLYYRLLEQWTSVLYIRIPLRNAFLASDCSKLCWSPHTACNAAYNPRDASNYD